MTTKHPPQSAATAGREGRRAFLFYTNWIEDTRTSLTPEQLSEFITIVVRYGCDGTPPDPDATPVVVTMFGLIRNVIDADLRKYEAKAERNRRAQARRATSAATSSAATKAPAIPTPDASSTPSATPTVAASATASHLADSQQDAPAVTDISNTHHTEPMTQHTSPTTQNPPLSSPSLIPSATDAGKAPEAAERSASPVSLVTPSSDMPAASAATTSVAATSATSASVAPSAAATTSAATPTTRRTGAPATIDEMRAYWQAHGLTSSLDEFWSYYSATGWTNKRGERLTAWKRAALVWDDRYRRQIAPMRRRIAEAERREREAERASEAAAERARQREARDAEADERQARAVSPDLGRYMTERALAITAGDNAAAMKLLRAASSDANLFDHLAEGYTAWAR